MSKFFSYKDIEKPVLLAGFEQAKNNGGSHQVYRQKQTGLMITIPKHPSGVSVGVGQKILEVVVLAARVSHINIGAKSNKLQTNVASYILDHHQKCKKNPLFLIPEDVRNCKKIENANDVRDYLAEQEKSYKKMQNSKHSEDARYMA
jgi:predicted RNA binding protein YcfA (HicA-like mRNA interferase family)